MPRLLFLAAALLLVSGCTFIRVQNVAEQEVTVVVRTPDSGKGYTRLVEPGGIVDVFSSYGGGYSVTIIPSERYRQALYRLRDDISSRLFNEGATLSADEVRNLVRNLNNIDQLIEDLELPGVTCSGAAPDFDTVVVIIGYDPNANSYFLNCQ